MSEPTDDDIISIAKSITYADEMGVDDDRAEAIAELRSALASRYADGFMSALAPAPTCGHPLSNGATCTEKPHGDGQWHTSGHPFDAIDRSATLSPRAAYDEGFHHGLEVGRSEGLDDLLIEWVLADQAYSDHVAKVQQIHASTPSDDWPDPDFLPFDRWKAAQSAAHKAVARLSDNDHKGSDKGSEPPEA